MFSRPTTGLVVHWIPPRSMTTKVWQKLQRMQGAMFSPSRAFLAQCPSAMRVRPRATMSALPPAMIRSASSGSVMPPVAITGTRTPLSFTSAARSTRVFGFM